MNPEDDRAASPAADAAVESEESTRTPEEIEAEIEATRGELGETVSALAEKADVKGQAQRKLEETKRNAQANLSGATETARELAVSAPERAKENPLPIAIAAGAVGLAAIVWLRRRRR
jgi:MYXO-CTERM domain-containing protein